MAGTARPTGRQRVPHLTLSSDSGPHLLQNLLAISVVVLGIVSFILGLIVRNTSAGTALAITASITGLYAVLVGLYAQMISATREQRVIIMTGLIAGFVGLALGLAHGGFG